MPFKMCILCLETYNVSIGHKCVVKKLPQGKHVVLLPARVPVKVNPKKVSKVVTSVPGQEYGVKPLSCKSNYTVEFVPDHEPVGFKQWMLKFAPKVKRLKL